MVSVDVKPKVSFPFSYTHTYTHILSLSLSYTHTRTLSLTHTHTRVHTYSFSLSLSYTHTHTHTLSLSPPPFPPPCLSSSPIVFRRLPRNPQLSKSLPLASRVCPQVSTAGQRDKVHKPWGVLDITSSRQHPSGKLAQAAGGTRWTPEV